MKYGLTEEQIHIIETKIPFDFLKTREIDKKNLKYLSGHLLFEILDMVFGKGVWTFTILDKWKEESTPFSIKKKWNNNGNAGEKDGQQPPVAMVMGRLSYPLSPIATYKGEDVSQYSIKYFTQDAIGSAIARGTATQQESNYKSAATDALKKAATLIGVTRDLYDSENKLDLFRAWLKKVKNYQLTNGSSGIDDLYWTEEKTAQYSKEQQKIMESIVALNKLDKAKRIEKYKSICQKLHFNLNEKLDTQIYPYNVVAVMNVLSQELEE